MCQCLVLEEIFSALKSIEQEVACARREMFRVVVTRFVELQGDVSVNADGKVVVHDIQRLKWQTIDKRTKRDKSHKT